MPPMTTSPSRTVHVTPAPKASVSSSPTPTPTPISHSHSHPHHASPTIACSIRMFESLTEHPKLKHHKQHERRFLIVQVLFDRGKVEGPKDPRDLGPQHVAKSSMTDTAEETKRQLQDDSLFYETVGRVDYSVTDNVVVVDQVYCLPKFTETTMTQFLLKTFSSVVALNYPHHDVVLSTHKRVWGITCKHRAQIFGYMRSLGFHPVICHNLDDIALLNTTPENLHQSLTKRIMAVPESLFHPGGQYHNPTQEHQDYNCYYLFKFGMKQFIPPQSHITSINARQQQQQQQQHINNHRHPTTTCRYIPPQAFPLPSRFLFTGPLS